MAHHVCSRRALLVAREKEKARQGGGGEGGRQLSVPYGVTLTNSGKKKKNGWNVGFMTPSNFQHTGLD